MNKRPNPQEGGLIHSTTPRGVKGRLGIGMAGMLVAFAWIGIAMMQAPIEARDLPPVPACPITANAGSAAVLVPVQHPVVDPTLFNASVTGVIQSDVLGTCVNQADLLVRFPTTPATPVIITGTATWTRIDGTGSVQITVSGSAMPDTANPGFYNARYDVVFTGGTGVYAGARGKAVIEEVVMFTSQTTATASWQLRGHIAPGH